MLFILLLLVDNKLEGNIVVVFGDGVGNGAWLLLLLLLLMLLLPVLLLQLLLLLRVLFTTPLLLLPATAEDRT